MNGAQPPASLGLYTNPDKPETLGQLAMVRLLSANPDGTAAIACIELSATSPSSGSTRTLAKFEQFLHRAGIAPLPVGGARVINVGNIDRAFVVRWNESSVTVMPHAGPLIVTGVLDFLLQKSRVVGMADAHEPALDFTRPPPAPSDFQTSGSELCARYLHATLATAASPAAIDLLLDQPRRWAAFAGSWHDAGVIARSRTLNRLLREPTVAAIGPPNIGKSSLLNALAGRAASLVADEPGTTRDHVGVSLVLGGPTGGLAGGLAGGPAGGPAGGLIGGPSGGLAVRWLDAPGFCPPVAQLDQGDLAAAAWRAALSLFRHAELVLLCGDADQPPLDPETIGLRSDQLLLRVALRSDRGMARWSHEIAVGGLGGAEVGGVGDGQTSGLGDLVARMHTELIPPAALEDPGPWVFWI